jgi:hypothetical protein
MEAAIFHRRRNWRRPAIAHAGLAIWLRRSAMRLLTGVAESMSTRARPELPEPPPLVPGPIVCLVEERLDVLHSHYTPSTVFDTEVGTVTFHAADLKHGHEESLLPFWVRFPTRESVSSFSAHYKVTVSEPIDTAGGELHFVVQAIENSGGQE